MALFRKSKILARMISRYTRDAKRLRELVAKEKQKTPSRTDIINHCIGLLEAQRYLEIGVRNPEDNFNKITCSLKESVDPGYEVEKNLATHKMTSDAFFEMRNQSGGEAYQVVFIDGLHRADQVARDIQGALENTGDDALILLHDSNPQAIEFASEDYSIDSSANGYWNGTTWKAVWQYFFEGEFECRVVDTDWGVAIIDKRKPKEPQAIQNPYFEFDQFAELRNKVGYLVSWDEAKSWLERP